MRIWQGKSILLFVSAAAGLQRSRWASRCAPTRAALAAARRRADRRGRRERVGALGSRRRPALLALAAVLRADAPRDLRLLATRRARVRYPLVAAAGRAELDAGVTRAQRRHLAERSARGEQRELDARTDSRPLGAVLGDAAARRASPRCCVGWALLADAASRAASRSSRRWRWRWCCCIPGPSSCGRERDRALLLARAVGAAGSDPDRAGAGRRRCAAAGRALAAPPRAALGSSASRCSCRQVRRLRAARTACASAGPGSRCRPGRLRLGGGAASTSCAPGACVVAPAEVSVWIPTFHHPAYPLVVGELLPDPLPSVLGDTRSDRPRRG